MELCRRAADAASQRAYEAPMGNVRRCFEGYCSRAPFTVNTLRRLAELDFSPWRVGVACHRLRFSGRRMLQVGEVVFAQPRD